MATYINGIDTSMGPITVGPVTITAGSIGINDGAGGPTVATEAAGSDAGANATETLATDARMSAFDGGAPGLWQRVRQGIAGVRSTFVGYLNTLPTAIYNATPTVRAEGEGGPLQTDASGALNVNVAASSGGGAVEAQANDATSNVENRLATAAYEMAFNGVSWDRVRSGLSTVANLATLTGVVNTLTAAIYNATPSARADTKAGPLETTEKGALKAALTDANNINAAAVDTIGDAAANAGYALDTDAKLSGYNATGGGGTWDRLRVGITTIGSTFTGFANQLPWAIFHTAPTGRANGEGGPLEATVGGALAVGITDGTVAGAQAPASIATTITDGVNAALNRLRTTSVLMVNNATAVGVSTIDVVRGGVTGFSTTVAGYLNVLPQLLYNASPATRTEGQYGIPQGDALGNALTSLGTWLYGEDSTNQLMRTMTKPVVDTQYSWSRYTNIANPITVGSAVVKASAGQIGSLYCRNTTASNRWIQLFNATSAPPSGVPILSFLVPPGSAILIERTFLGDDGTNFATGITWGLSTTETTFTAATATDGLVVIMYV